MEIIVYSTKTGTQSKVNTTARTWGALRTQLLNSGHLTNDMAAINGNDKTTFQNEEIVLPTECFTLFLVPTKTKSGSCGNEVPFTEEEITDLWESLDTVFEYLLNHIDDSKKKEVAKLRKEADALLKGMVQ